MKTSIKKELAQSILDKINDEILTNDNRDDWHYHAFNEDYYIIGYFEANEWLKKHDLDVFEAIETVRDYEVTNFGKFTTKVNSEAIANMIAYIYGEDLIYSEDFKNIKQLKKAMKEIAKEN